MTRIGLTYNILLMQHNMANAKQAHSDSILPLSTGKSINRLSDYPTRISELFNVSTRITRGEQYGLNINAARTRVSVTDSVLEEMNNLVTEAYTIALQGNDASLTVDDIAGITQRLTDIKTSLVDLANTKQGSTYIFSGYKTSTVPFSGTPTVYNGDTNILRIKVSSTKTVVASINPSIAFMGTSGGRDMFDNMDDLVTAIQARDSAAIGSRITDMQTVMSQFSIARSTMGNALKELDISEEFISDSKQRDSERISVLSDLDVAQASAELSYREFALKSSYAVAKRVFDISLQDFLT